MLQPVCLIWGGAINPLAAAVKCCWKYTTVSPSYLQELSISSNGLEYLFYLERLKGTGIINGIDTDVWDPKKDPMLPNKFSIKQLAAGKLANKQALCARFNLSVDKPLISFIGRLVGEKGAELLAAAMERSFNEHPGGFNFLVLGTGEKWIERELLQLKEFYPEQCNVFIGYDEALAHLIYGGSDFLLIHHRG